jgi:NAD(P)H-flavin reductase
LGYSTLLLGALEKGASLYALVGPLGHTTEIKDYGTVILVGGGVGIAEIYPVAKALRAAGNKIITILGSRTKDLLILEDELKKTSDELHICTDDGSYGRKGFTTDVLKDILTRDEGRRTRDDLVYTVGPIPMMKKVAEVTKAKGIKTMASLNALMVDGTGMCGCCRVTIGGEVKFTCIDGPEFDAHLVDWDGLAKRNCVYEDKEKHICRLNP